MCSCGQPSRTPRIGGIRPQRTCLTCHAAYMRKWRKTHKLSPEARVRDNCRSYLNVYLKRGKIVRGSCETCGAPGVEAHHADYLKPLEVKWFCRQHHVELTHENLRSGS